MPHLLLSRALDCGDEDAIWRCLADAREPELCSDWLAALAGTVTRHSAHLKYPSRTTHWSCSLIATPFLIWQTPPLAAQPCASGAELAGAFFDEWRSWIGAPQQVAVLGEIVPYSEVCHWSPVTQRECLATLARQPIARPTPRLPPMARVPDTFPQLNFVVGSVSRWLAFAALPPLDAPGLRLWELRTRLAAHLSYHYGQGIQPLDVDAPALFAEAVASGLRMWLHELARRELVGSWRIEPAGKDIVLLDLMPATGDPQAVRIPLRGHQLGRGGIDLMLLEVQQLFGRSSPEGRALN
jgi:hypothetical protein